jgi:hypothetical protein
MYWLEPHHFLFRDINEPQPQPAPNSYVSFFFYFALYNPRQESGPELHNFSPSYRTASEFCGSATLSLILNLNYFLGVAGEGGGPGRSVGGQRLFGRSFR